MASWIIDAQLGNDNRFPGRARNEDPSSRANWKNRKDQTSAGNYFPTAMNTLVDPAGQFITNGVAATDYVRVHAPGLPPGDWTVTVLSVDSETTLTLDAGLPSAIVGRTDVTYAIGGAFASFGKATSLLTDGDFLYFRGSARESPVTWQVGVSAEIHFMDGAFLTRSGGTFIIQLPRGGIFNSVRMENLILDPQGTTAIGSTDFEIVFSEILNCHVLSGTMFDYKSNPPATGTQLTVSKCSALRSMGRLFGPNNIDPFYVITNCTVIDSAGGTALTVGLSSLNLGKIETLKDCVFRSSIPPTSELVCSSEPPNLIDFNTYILPDPSDSRNLGHSIIFNFPGVTISTDPSASPNWADWVNGNVGLGIDPHPDEQLILMSDTKAPGTPHATLPNCIYGPLDGWMVNPSKGLGAPKPDAPWRNISSTGGPRGAFSVAKGLWGFTTANVDLTNAIINGDRIQGDPAVPAPMTWQAVIPSQTLSSGTPIGDFTVQVAGDGTTRALDFGAEVELTEIFPGDVIEYGTSYFDDTALDDASAGASDRTIFVEGWTEIDFAANPSPPTFSGSFARWTDLTTIPASSRTARYWRLNLKGTAN